jgi:hypothetical protein
MSAKRRLRRASSRRHPGLDPALRGAVDALTSDRQLRAAMYEAMGAVDTPDALEALASLPAAQRAMLYLAVKDAALALVARKPCDNCRATAQHIKFVVVWPGEDFRTVRKPRDTNTLTGFVLLCGQCARMSAGALKRHVLDQYAALQTAVGLEPARREAILGPGVGEVASLPPRCRLEVCADCQRPTWIDPDSISGPVDEVVYLCLDCAERAAAAGRLESVPVALIA